MPYFDIENAPAGSSLRWSNQPPEGYVQVSMQDIAKYGISLPGGCKDVEGFVFHKGYFLWARWADTPMTEPASAPESPAEVVTPASLAEPTPEPALEAEAPAGILADPPLDGEEAAPSGKTKKGGK